MKKKAAAYDWTSSQDSKILHYINKLTSVSLCGHKFDKLSVFKKTKKKCKACLYIYDHAIKIKNKEIESGWYQFKKSTIKHNIDGDTGISMCGKQWDLMLIRRRQPSQRYCTRCLKKLGFRNVKGVWMI